MCVYENSINTPIFVHMLLIMKLNNIWQQVILLRSIIQFNIFYNSVKRINRYQLLLLILLLFLLQTQILPAKAETAILNWSRYITDSRRQAE